MLVVTLGFLTVGYTLLWAGIKNQHARDPWQLWAQAFQQLGTEASARQAGVAAMLQRVQQQAQQQAAAARAAAPAVNPQVGPPVNPATGAPTPLYPWGQGPPI